MARQTYYVTREQKHPLYHTRMLKAGPIELDAGAARLYRQLGVDLSDEAPRRAAKVEESPRPVEVQSAVAPATKRAPRKRKATTKKKS